MIDVEKVGMELCNAIEDAGIECEQCPFVDRCSRGSYGTVNWLKEKLEE